MLCTVITNETCILHSLFRISDSPMMKGVIGLWKRCPGLSFTRLQEALHHVHRQVSTGRAAISQPVHYLDGQRIQPLNPNQNDEFEILEPATGEVLNVTRSSNTEDVDKAVQSSKKAFKEWSQTSGMERGKLLYEAARIVRANREELARAEVHDTGKAIWEARFDIDGCADSMEFFAGLAPTIAGQHVHLPAGSFGYTRREALGVCGGIGAWNYPFQMACWKSAPALACGNTMVFKPSQFTPHTAVMLAEIYSDAGIPKGVYNIVQGAAETGEMLSSHPDICKMSFTGSVPVGSKVMANCAKDIKHVTLELGGKSPLIIFDDAHLENAVKGAMMANFLTQGQVCSNGTRVFVHKSIYEAFLERFVAKTKSMKIGDPFDESTHVGAMIHKEQANKVLNFVDISKKEGGEVMCGGERVVPAPHLAGGHYVSPCVVAGVTDNMTVAKEEVFGSLASVLTFDSEEEVIQRANNTQFGLAGGVFTNDLNRAHRVVSALEVGSLYVNNYNVYPCELPFGGYKKSGIGRENGIVTLEYYTQVKSVYVEGGDVWCPF